MTHKRKTTPRTRTAPAVTRRQPVKAPEPHLAALLAYIDGVRPSDAAESHADIVTIADRAIAEAPRSFSGDINAANQFALILERLERPDRRDADDYSQQIATAVAMMRAEVDGVDGKYAYAAFISAVGDGMLIGAAMMYRLLRGGNR